MPEKSPPKCPVRPILMIGLLGAILGIFFSYARSGADWEILQTEHYWAADKWYYGGCAAQFVATPGGFRTVIAEALCNYSNMLALQEKLPAERARHPVQGFPGTERLATPFIAYSLLRVPGEAADAWRVFWQANVLLWLLSAYLTYRIAALYFGDPCAPWIAAILVTLYPALTLTFNAIKQQTLGTTYLLLGIYLFEGHLRRAGPAFRVIALAAAMFFGQFADGGWLFLAAFIFLRAWWLPGCERWAALICLGAAVGLSGLWLSWLGRMYHLPAVTHALRFSVGRILGESGRWLGAWAVGGALSSQSFLNFPGTTFFNAFWPVICRGFLSNHAPLLVAAIAGLFLEPRSRMFTFLAVPMLFVGHSGMIVAGWYYYYGYLSFPAAVMVIFGASGALGNLAGRRAALPRITALAMVAFACWSFTDLKRQAGIYYGQSAEYYRRKMEVHYGNEAGHDTF